MLKLVRQQHENGCVPACIAMVSGLPYARVLRFFAHNHKWNTQGSTIKTMLKVLRKIGLKVKTIKPVDLRTLDTDAILDVKHTAYGPPGWNHHVVVWDHKRQRIWDPYPSKKRFLKRHLPLASYQKTMLGIYKIY